MKATIKNTLGIATALFAFSFLFTRCDSGDEFESNNKAKVTIDLSGEITQCSPACLLIDENNPSNKYVRIDSITQYGLGTDYLLPDSLKDCDLKIIASGKMRESATFKGCIAFNLFNNRDSLLQWTIIKSETYVHHLNSWIPFKDSIIIGKDVNKMSAKTLRIFSFKNAGAGTFDVDDLRLDIIKQ